MICIPRAVAESAVLDIFRSSDPPSALFSAQNRVTVGAIRALRQLGLQHDVALVGFDDFELADLLEPGVTVVAQDATATAGWAPRFCSEGSTATMLRSNNTSFIPA